MASPVFSAPNHAESGSASGGSYEATLPVTNLTDARLRKKARSADATKASTQALIDLLSTKLVRVLGLFDHNVSRTGASYRLRLYDDGETFSRADTGTYFDEDGAVTAAASGELRRWHYATANDDVTYRATLLERAYTNLVGTALSGWGNVGTPGSTGSQNDPADGTGAYLLEDNDGAVAEAKTLAVTFTGDGTKSIKIKMKAGTAGATRFGIYDTTAGTWRHQIKATWAGGVPSLSTVSGSGILFGEVALQDGFYVLAASVAGVVAANTNTFYIYPAYDSAASDTGTVTVWEPEAFNATVPPSSSLVASEATTADNFTIDLALTTPQEATYLFEGLVLDLPNAGTHRYPFQIGSGTSGCLGVYYRGDADRLFVAFNNGSSLVQGYWDVSLSLFDHIAVRLYQASNGAITAGLSINGGAEDTTLDSAISTQALPGSWNANTVTFGNTSGASACNLGLIRFLAQSGSERTLVQMRALAQADIAHYEVYDSQWQDAYPAIYPSGELLWGAEVGGLTVTADQYSDGLSLPIIEVMAKTIPGRYFSIEIDDTSNADGYFEAGLAWAGSAYQPVNAVVLMQSAKFDIVDESAREILDGGALVHYRRAKRKMWSLDLGYLSENEVRVQLNEFKRYVGATRHVLFIPDPDDALELYLRSVLGYQDSSSPAAVLAASSQRQPLAFIEDL